MKTIDFSRKRNCTELETLATIVANSSKIHRIRSKNASLDSIRFALQVYTKNFYLSFNKHVLYRKNEDFLVSRILNRPKDQIVDKRI